MKKTVTEESYENFSKIRKNTTTTTRETRKSFRSYVNSVCSDSSKKFLSYIKSLRVNTVGIPTFKKDGKLRVRKQFESRDSEWSI